jgi:hypothetical protein
LFKKKTEREREKEKPTHCLKKFQFSDELKKKKGQSFLETCETQEKEEAPNLRMEPPDLKEKVKKEGTRPSTFYSKKIHTQHL